MNTKKICSCLVILVGLLLAISVTSVSANATKTKFDKMKGLYQGTLTYADPYFDFSVRYPDNWVVNPRDDSYGVGATLTFVPNNTNINHINSLTDPHSSLPKIEIGFYLVEWLNGKTLKEWTDSYNALMETW